jgi:hypothetical protein
MDTVLRYRGREVSSADVAFIASLIAEHPQAKRKKLSVMLCQAWNWVQPNGALRDGVCRSLLLTLHRAGHIMLPPSQCPKRRAPARRRRVAPAEIEVPSDPVCAPLGAIGPVEIRQVRRTPEEALVEGLLARHHYLGYQQPVGEHLKYLVVARSRPVACFCWSSAPLHLDARDRYIGWSHTARRTNLRLVAYQSRFLILPWVRVPHLASHLLGRMSRQLSADWERMYAHPIYWAMTFVDPSRYRGTCYRAANWTYLGMTSGRGHNAPTKRKTVPPKQVFGYPLVRDFRRRLCEGT